MAGRRVRALLTARSAAPSIATPDGPADLAETNTCWREVMYKRSLGRLSRTIGGCGRLVGRARVWGAVVRAGVWPGSWGVVCGSVGRSGGGGGGAVLAELEQVGGEVHECPFAVGGGEAAAAEAGHRAVVFAVGEDGLDGVASVGRRRLAPSGVRRRCSIASIGVASGGGGPVVWPSSRAARRCLWSLRVAIRRSGPGAVALAFAPVAGVGERQAEGGGDAGGR